MVHRGEITKKRVKESGVHAVVIHKALNVSRSSLYRFYELANLDLDTILKIGKVIRYDFSKDFPELRNISAEENLSYKIKYFALLEKHLEVLEKIADKGSSTKRKK